MDATSGIDSMTTEQVHKSSPLFKCNKFDEFKGYFNKNDQAHQIKELAHGTLQEKIDYSIKTVWIFLKIKYHPRDTHAAKKRKGMASLLSTTVDLRLSRDGYQNFNPDPSRGHIHLPRRR